MTVGQIMKRLTVIVIVAGFIYFVFSWFHRHRKKVGDANELEWLDELVQEHLAGRDQSDRLERLIRTIEKNHEPSSALTVRLANTRRILGQTKSARITH
jgi:hypothetical protein